MNLRRAAKAGKKGPGLPPVVPPHPFWYFVLPFGAGILNGH